MNLVPLHKNKSQEFLYKLGELRLGDEAELHHPIVVRRYGVRQLGRYVTVTAAGAALWFGASVYYGSEPPPEKTPEAPAEPYAKELGSCNRIEEHIVKQGEGAYGIAAEHDVDPRDRGAVVAAIVGQAAGGLLHPGMKVDVFVPLNPNSEECRPSSQNSYEPGAGDLPGGYGS